MVRLKFVSTPENHNHPPSHAENIASIMLVRMKEEVEANVLTPSSKDKAFHISYLIYLSLLC